MPDLSVLREHMVRDQIAARGVRDARVLDAMRAVPREAFMPEALEEFAYDDTPLPIEEGQTISQPYIVALMIAAIRPGPRDRVLEIGAGSGYAAAVLSRVVGHVYAVERHEALANLARRRLRTLGYDNVEVLHGDGKWLRSWNADRPDGRSRAGFYGLDLYSLFTSIAAVLRYLDEVDPDTAALARRRYACLSPWERDPAVYGRAALTGRYRTCEEPVTRMLRDMMARRLDYVRHDGERFLDAAQNARLVTTAERYYRAMYYGQVDSWNLRDRHMFEPLDLLLTFHGPEARAVVWEHNSHVGNAAATEMGARGEFNVGQLCRERFGRETFLVGFGTDHGTVAAARDWNAPMQVMTVRPSIAESYERLFHDSDVPGLLLSLGPAARPAVRDELRSPRLERAIGVVYRPETELQSHYFQAVLPAQFDEYVWFDETSAVRALPALAREGMPDTYPFGV
jgi:erythromycin esterase-like protein